MLELINRAYDLLAETGLTTTQANYSRIYLGQSGGYYGYLRSSAAPPSLGCMAHLADKIRDAIWYTQRMGPMTPEARTRTGLLLDIARKLTVVVFTEALRRRRSIYRLAQDRDAADQSPF
jgi:hypothetical protein